MAQIEDDIRKCDVMLVKYLEKADRVVIVALIIILTAVLAMMGGFHLIFIEILINMIKQEVYDLFNHVLSEEQCQVLARFMFIAHFIAVIAGTIGQFVIIVLSVTSGRCFNKLNQVLPLVEQLHGMDVAKAQETRKVFE